MNKIPTLFERNNRTKKVMPIYSEVAVAGGQMTMWTPTEKINGANVRLTVRSHRLVRLEVRANPKREQKEIGILNPWYRDAGSVGTSDKWLWEAAMNTDLSGVPDGEWSGEAIGERIQGNPLDIEGHRVILFSLNPWADVMPVTVPLAPSYDRVPIEFEELKYWIADRRSGINPDAPIEGIVWWLLDTPVAKVKVKDFDYKGEVELG